MTEGRMIKGYKVHESPVPGKFNKFVITEDQAWFVAMEDGLEVFHAEIMAEFLEDLDGLDGDKFDDGRNMMGIVAKETGEVTVYNWDPDDSDMVDSEVVKRRIREIFPHAEYFVAGDFKRHQL